MGRGWLYTGLLESEKTLGTNEVGGLLNGEVAFNASPYGFAS